MCGGQVEENQGGEGGAPGEGSSSLFHCLSETGRFLRGEIWGEYGTGQRERAGVSTVKAAILVDVASAGTQ